jgi:hypothetical protein
MTEKHRAGPRQPGSARSQASRPAIHDKVTAAQREFRTFRSRCECGGSMWLVDDPDALGLHAQPGPGAVVRCYCAFLEAVMT